MKIQQVKLFSAPWSILLTPGPKNALPVEFARSQHWSKSDFRPWRTHLNRGDTERDNDMGQTERTSNSYRTKVYISTWMGCGVLDRKTY